MLSRRFIILLIATLLFAGQVVLYWDYSIDDAYITYRYSEHLADGHGLVFNIGDKPIEAYSNALWMFLLSLLYLVGFPTVLTAKILGIVFFVAAGWLWFWHFRNDISKYAWLAGPLFLLCPLTAFWAVSGLELGLHCFAIVLAVIFILRRSRWSCLPLALIVWGRPEGFMTAFAIVGAAITSDMLQKKLRFKEYVWPIASIAFAIAAITILRLIVFGLPLPNTFYVKTGKISFHVMAIYGMVVRFIPVFTLMLWAMWAAVKNRLADKAVVIALAAFITQFIVSSLVDPVMNFLFRYLAPFILLAIFPALVVSSEFKKKSYQVLGLAVIILSLISPVKKIFRHIDIESEIISAQEKLIDWANRLPGTYSISLTDIGRIPYYTKQHYIDIWGLASANIRKRGFNPLDEFLKFPDYFVFVGYMQNRDLVKLRFGRENLIANIQDMPKIYPLIGWASPDSLPIDSFGYHYLILKKDQAVLDSIVANSAKIKK